MKRIRAFYAVVNPPYGGGSQLVKEWNSKYASMGEAADFDAAGLVEGELRAESDYIVSAMDPRDMDIAHIQWHWPVGGGGVNEFYNGDVVEVYEARIVAIVPPRQQFIDLLNSKGSFLSKEEKESMLSIRDKVDSDALGNAACIAASWQDALAWILSDIKIYKPSLRIERTTKSTAVEFSIVATLMQSIIQQMRSAGVPLISSSVSGSRQYDWSFDGRFVAIKLSTVAEDGGARRVSLSLKPKRPFLEGAPVTRLRRFEINNSSDNMSAFEADLTLLESGLKRFARTRESDLFEVDHV